MSKKLNIKKNDYTFTTLDENDIQEKVDAKVDIAQGSNKANKNVVTDASGNITTEAKIDVSGKEDASNKSSSIFTDTGSITKYPTVKAVEDYAQPKGNYLTEHQTIPSIPTKTSDLTNDSGFLTEHQTLPTFATVATTGDYDDLDNKPSIPTKTSDLTNDSDYITSTEVDDTYATKDAIDNIVAGDIDLTGYAKSNEIPRKTSDLTNDSGFLTEHQTLPTYATVATSGSYDDLDNKPSIPTKTSDLTNDSGFLTEHQTLPTLATVATSGSYNDLDNKPSIPTKTSDLTNDGDGTNAFLTEHQTLPTYATVATSGDYSDLSNTPNLSDLGGIVTVEKQQNAEDNSVSTYVVKQNGTQVGAKINIPKDFLVKSASVNTCSTTGTPNGFTQGDKYIDFIINSKDNDDTDEHLYINVNDLVDTYTAGTGLTLNDNTFSVNIADLSIPTKTSDLTNDSGFLTSHNPVDNSLSSSSTNAVQNKVINDALNDKADSSHTHNYQTPLDSEHHRLHSTTHLYRYGKVVTMVVSGWLVQGVRDIYETFNYTIPEGWRPSYKTYLTDITTTGTHMAILPTGVVQYYVDSNKPVPTAMFGSVTWIVYDKGDDDYNP